MKVAPTYSLDYISLVLLKGLNYDPSGTANPFKCRIFDISEADTKNDALTNNTNYFAPDLLSATTIHVTSDDLNWMITGIRARDAHLGNLRTR